MVNPPKKHLRIRVVYASKSEHMRASPGSIPRTEAEQKQQPKGNCREIYNKLKEETVIGPVDHITQIATLSLRNHANM